MRNTLLVASGLALSALIIAGAGCTDTSKPVRRPSETTETVNTNQVTITEYAVGEEATAGDIVHVVTAVEVLDVIPASATLPEWEIIAEETPADEGFTWVHINGEVTNNSKESQTITTNGVYVVDADGNQFDVSTDTTIYVDGDQSPVYISLQPTQTVEWEGYFEVPQAAAGLALVGNDLSFLPESEVRIDLGL